MSVAATQLPPAPPDEPVFRLSVQQYHTMIETGVLTDDDPVELLEGILVFKMPKKPNHRLAVRLLTSVIDAMLPTGWHFQAQEPITLSDGEPEPDGAIICGQPRDYTQRHPGPGDVILVIEVADTTLDRDRGIKLRSYARAGIPEYWIIDLVSRTAQVYRNPNPRREPPAYDPPQIDDQDAVLSITLATGQLLSIPLSKILP